jgi:hypothetical protein
MYCKIMQYRRMKNLIVFYETILLIISECKISTKDRSPLQVNTEYDHPRLYLVKHIGETEVLITGMNISQAVAYFYFG